MALPPQLQQQPVGPAQNNAGSTALHQALMNARLAKRPMQGGVQGAPAPQGGAGGGHKVTLTVQPHTPPRPPNRGF